MKEYAMSALYIFFHVVCQDITAFPVFNAIGWNIGKGGLEA
jgi:hypothetical protein